MTSDHDPFKALDQALRREGEAGLLDELARRTRRDQKPRELFEVLKMQARRAAGLPPLQWRAEHQLPPAVRDHLEQGMFAACREVGMLLLDQGKLREGWMYLQPVGDVPAVAQRLANIGPTAENIDELIEVSLYEGVDSRRGYALMLEHYGVRNSITAFDSTLAQRPRDVQQAAADLLVRRLHRDLLANAWADVQRREETAEAPPQPGTTLRELVASRGWLVGEGSYHIDTTHLASTVRFARVLQDAEPLRLAIDLTDYGRRLNSTFQYPGEEPFVDQYVSHGHYLRALAGEQVDEALAYFAAKTRSLPASEYGRYPLEVYADLLARVGRPAEAIEALEKLAPEGSAPLGVAPALLELHLQAGLRDQWLERCRQQNDALGYASGLLAQPGPAT